MFHLKRIGLSLSFVLFASAAQGATFLGSWVTNPNNGHAYRLTDNTNWLDAETLAIANGGHLVTIRSANEQAWIYSNIVSPVFPPNGAGRGIWIGLNDSASEGSFIWSSSESSAYTNWQPAAPDDTDGTQDYVAINAPDATTGALQWNDWPGNIVFNTNAKLYGVVEVVPEPATLTLVATAGLLLAIRPRGTIGFSQQSRHLGDAPWARLTH